MFSVLKNVVIFNNNLTLYLLFRLFNYEVKMINKYLKAQGYNLRERLNFYFGLAIPQIATTLGTYYLLDKTIKTNDPLSIAGKIVLSLLPNVPLFPFEIGTSQGLILVSLLQLRNRKTKQKGGLEKQVL